MKIINIRIKESETTVSLLADCKIRRIGWDTMYFTFDKRYKDFIYKDASPFVAALLIPAMYLGEDIVVEEHLSRRLFEGMGRIMDKILEWKWPMKHIEIKDKNIAADTTEPKAKNVGVFFSGGVDSFYTYLKHQKDVNDPITHLILVNGNDIDLRNKKLWDATKQNIQDVAKEGGVELITVETNTQSLLEPIISPDFTHGGSLAAVGLCLRKGFKKIYIPSSFSVEEQVPYGSHPDLDKHWSTEGLLFEHDGTEVMRFQKLEREIIHSPVALKYLRVCYMNKKQAYNCGRCEKCLRTMISLHILGKLKEATTFPPTIDLARVTEVVAASGPINTGHWQNLAFLKKKNMDIPLQRAIEKGLSHVTDTTHTSSYRLYKKIQYIDHMYFYGIAFKVWDSLKHRY